jgi:hypothetical protein
MAQPKKPVVKPSNIKIKDKKPTGYSSSAKNSSTLFSSLDGWLDRNSKTLLVIILGISIVFSLFVFQARMDIGGDDSGYILRAYDFIHKGVFPSYQGPLYPLVLSIFVSFTGIKIVFLKFLSVIFNLVALLFLYKAFKGRVPSLVLYSVLLLTGINTYILNFASLTYNEAFYMALQYVFFYYFFKLQDFIQLNNNAPLKNLWRAWLPVAILLFLITITRNIGISCFGGLIMYFAFCKQFRNLLYTSVLFLASGLYMKSQGSSQGNILLLKNPYNAAEGNRHFSDFMSDFFQNSNLYLSKRFYQILGFKSETDIETSTLLTFFTVLFLAFCIYRVIRSKNKYLLIVSLYILSMIGATFIVLQTRWDQPRLIMIYMPLLLMLFLYGLYDISKKRAWGLQMLTVLLVPVIFVSEFSSTIQKAKENLPILQKNLKGDIYAGFTPDWVNYLKLSQWCENLPKDSLVACRKGPMSSVYANGREFFSIARTDNIDITNADTVVAWFKRNNVRYILLAKLRINPLNPDQGFINTIHRLVTPIAKKYPQKLKFIKQEGQSEEAQLYELLY